MTNERFLEAFRDHVRTTGWRSEATPAALIERWDAFVRACEEGYASTIYEYESERAVRDVLEQVLSATDLKRFPQTSQLQDAVAMIDVRFRRACRDDAVFVEAGAPWWRRCVPRRSEGEFALDLLDQERVRLMEP